MSSYCCHTYRTILRLGILALVSAPLLAGCGQGIGNDTAGVGVGGTGSGVTFYSRAAKATAPDQAGIGISGHVTANAADGGYLLNATVFLDRNNNYQPDADEPSTTTDAAGAYTLLLDPADIGACPLAALAVKGQTIDQNSGQPLADSYLLVLPKENIGVGRDHIISAVPEAPAEPVSR